jgi:uncharacterized protein DUF3108
MIRSVGRVAQWESTVFTPRGSLVRSQPRPPFSDHRWLLWRRRSGLSRQAARVAVALAVALALGRPAAADALAARYTATWAGLPAGEIYLRLDGHGDAYRGDAAIRTEGLPRWFTRFRGRAVGEGRLLGDGSVTPARYDARYDLRKRRNKGLSLRFVPVGGALVAERGPADTSSKPPLPEIDRRNVVDPIAALIAIRHQIRTGALRRNGRVFVPVYDGSRRFDLEGSAEPHAEDGVLRLGLQLRPLAGFKGESSEDENPDEAPRAVRLDLSDDERLIPLRMEVTIAWFTTVVALDHLCTAATPCAVDFEATAGIESAR